MKYDPRLQMLISYFYKYKDIIILFFETVRLYFNYKYQYDDLERASWPITYIQVISSIAVTTKTNIQS